MRLSSSRARDFIRRGISVDLSKVIDDEQEEEVSEKDIYLEKIEQLINAFSILAEISSNNEENVGLIQKTISETRKHTEILKSQIEKNDSREIVVTQNNDNILLAISSIGKVLTGVNRNFDTISNIQEKLLTKTEDTSKLSIERVLVSVEKVLETTNNLQKKLLAKQEEIKEREWTCSIDRNKKGEMTTVKIIES